MKKILLLLFLSVSPYIFAQKALQFQNFFIVVETEAWMQSSESQTILVQRNQFKALKANDATDPGVLENLTELSDGAEVELVDNFSFSTQYNFQDSLIPYYYNCKLQLVQEKIFLACTRTDTHPALKREYFFPIGTVVQNAQPSNIAGQSLLQIDLDPSILLTSEPDTNQESELQFFYTLNFSALLVSRAREIDKKEFRRSLRRALPSEAVNVNEMRKRHPALKASIDSLLGLFEKHFLKEFGRDLLLADDYREALHQLEDYLYQRASLVDSLNHRGNGDIHKDSLSYRMLSEEDQAIVLKDSLNLRVHKLEGLYDDLMKEIAELPHNEKEVKKLLAIEALNVLIEIYLLAGTHQASIAGLRNSSTITSLAFGGLSLLYLLIFKLPVLPESSTADNITRAIPLIFLVASYLDYGRHLFFGDTNLYKPPFIWPWIESNKKKKIARAIAKEKADNNDGNLNLLINTINELWDSPAELSKSICEASL